MDNLEYQKRRDLLLDQIEDNSVVLISGAAELTRNSDCHFEFRQDSDFFYLTGFEEPQAFLVLIKSASEKKFILFNRESNYQEELWEGERAGLKGAIENYGADEAFDISMLFNQVAEILENKSHIYYRPGDDLQVDALLPKWISALKSKVRKGISLPEHLHDVEALLSEMRLIKSEFEINIMRKVCKISAAAHKRAMQTAHRCDYEYQVQAEINHELMHKGCQNVAYNSIVAAGKNACVLHYTTNNSVINDNDLILIDVGGELNNYAADITRTFPKKGVFSKEQKALYQIVLDAQKAGIDVIKPGVVWSEIQQVMVKIICQGLLSLGLLSGTLDEVIDNKSYQKFYMHNSGHWLGLDVHDKGAYKENNQWRGLLEGMILTVEPGIYIASHHKDIDAKWHNIGIRIEDDILVTESGHENLTCDVPREIDQIEALISNAM